MREKKYTILNPLNHNAFICESVDTKEKYVFFGKGIGLKKKKGEIFEYNHNVQDTMLVLESDEATQYRDLVNIVENQRLVDIVQNIVYEANKYFEGKVNAKLNLTLLDHLNFALERQKNNIIMNYPFLGELKFIYPKEYEFSRKAYEYLNAELKDFTKFDEAELGFLVLHIHAAVTDAKVSKVLMNNEIMYKCAEILESNMNEKIDRNSIYYSRFTKHLKYAIQRYKNGIKLQNILLTSIKETCKEDYKIALEINSFLKGKYHIDLDENEIGYLTLHIYNLRNRKNQY